MWLFETQQRATRFFARGGLRMTELVAAAAAAVRVVDAVRSALGTSRQLQNPSRDLKGAGFCLLLLNSVPFAPDL
jgi:hypothetical protein